MGRIKIVLLFNEEDERQNEVAKYLKTQPRCKTALITELLYDWLLKKKGVSPAGETSPVTAGENTVKDVKEALLTDRAFLNCISEMLAEQKENADEPHKRQSGKTETAEVAALDMDEDLLLAGLSMFETQI